MEKIKKIFNRKTYPFIILFLAMCIITLIKPLDFGDDVAFANVLVKGTEQYSGTSNIFEYLGIRYNTWTSRVIIEFFLVLFTYKLPLLWKLIDPFIYLLIAYSIKRVFLKDKDEKLSWILVFLILMITIPVTKEAGSIATALNYIWPIAFGLTSLIPIRKAIDSEKVRWYEYLIYIPMTIFAVNAELVGACVLTTYVIFTIYLAIKKKIKPIIAVLLIVSIITMIFTFTCPGNKIRTEREIESKFNEFENLTFVDKFVIGLLTEMDQYIMIFSPFYFIFTLIMMITVFKKHDNVLLKGISAFPFVLGIMFTIMPVFFESFVTRILDFSIISQKNLDYRSLKAYAQAGIYLLDIIFMFISLYLAFGKTNKTLVSMLTLGCGVCSRLIMGFIPTVFASGVRTQLIFFTMFIVLIMMLVEEKDKKFRDIMLNLLIVFAIFFK